MKLLVVEDEALLRHHLQTRLTDSGHVVESVANAVDALYQTGQFNHDLAVIDLGLPGPTTMWSSPSSLKNWKLG
jgi:two-component system response regulator PhoP